MSGLLALLDDVAGIAKIAAASVDDITAHAAKAGSKAAGVVIDDAAVTPKYVTGFEPARELPIIWRIARGSLVNKLVILLPIALLLSAFAPWALPPLLILGGAYLCYEGAEKAVHALGVGKDHGGPDGSHAVKDPGKLEEQKVKGAIKTDFILSAEIMTISLATIESDSILLQAVILAVVGVAITAIVYGAVAVIVKMDDVGLWLGKNASTGAGRSLGRGIVKVMPYFLKLLAFVGTVAMLWVGGSIILHSVGQMGWHGPEDWVHDIAYGASEIGAVRWTLTAAIDGVFGLALGLLLVPLGAKVIAPAWGAIFKSSKAA
ncbi:DUF808 domain-containing protein [Citreimonas salinaria]|uniref:Inner membrane protein YedI n=1 Tax=Citreimonas salinaria TaxID=321339 RepID=A0A1H3GH17_9RHOB|nr:DUF808 domain-containing protein [Citreimonas salinaria]SDY02662.1 hypothetical protein SAMN05444340_102351 [Citreimonas salinaria]